MYECFPACVSVFYVCAVTAKARGGAWSPGTGEPPGGLWGWNPGPLEVLLITKLSLKPLTYFLNLIFKNCVCMCMCLCSVYVCGTCTGVRRPSGALFYYSLPYPLKAVSLTELGAKLAGNKHLQSDTPVSGLTVWRCCLLQGCWGLELRPSDLCSRYSYLLSSLQIPISLLYSTFLAQKTKSV